MQEPNNSRPGTSQLLGIQALRGFAAMLVVLAHYRLILHGLPEDGFFNIFMDNSLFAVDLFFLISGFIIVYTTRSVSIRGGERFKVFALKRALRIFPVYYICFFAYVLLFVLPSFGAYGGGGLGRKFSLEAFF